MTSVLLEQANRSMVEVDRIVATYRFSSVGLKADSILLAHVNKNLKPRDIDVKGDFDTDAYLEFIRSGTPRHLAARQIGMEPKEVQKRIKFDGAFRESVELAEEEASEVIEEKLWKLAQVGERWAMELWLKKRHKNRWGDDPTIVKHEGTVVQELSAAPIVEQIMALQGILSQRVELTTGNNHDIIDVDDADFEDDES